jgi:hypothetical protein
MSIKSLFSILITSVLIFSCSNEKEITEIDYGNIDSNWEYTSNTFGLKFTLPQNYYFSRPGSDYPDGIIGNSNFKVRLQENGNKMINISEFATSEFGKGKNILTLFREAPPTFISSPSDLKPIEKINIEAIIPVNAYNSEKEFFEEVHKLSIRHNEPLNITNMNLAGVEFKTAKIELENFDHSAVKIFMAQKKYSNVFLSLTIYYSSEEFLKEALSILNSGSDK